jgi:antitoxin (DNA-binding transcriptional repressor) of toxin-antitoxin stability system
MDDVLRVSASEFKARCLAIFRDLEARRVGRVLVTRRGRPVAELTPPRTRLPTHWGAHRGSVQVEPGIDPHRAGPRRSARRGSGSPSSLMGLLDAHAVLWLDSAAPMTRESHRHDR